MPSSWGEGAAGSMRGLAAWWRAKPGRVRLAVGLLVAVAVGWPVTAVAQAVGVPLFEQVMLGLSWLAPAVSAIDVLFTAQIHEKEGRGDGAGGRSRE